MTGAPLSNLDSGFCSGISRDRSSFSFEPDDICSNQIEDILPHSSDDSLSRRITPCNWTVEASGVYQRRKRSLSCPSTSRTFLQTPSFQRSQSCQDDSFHERSSITTMTRRSVDTQTLPSGGNYCDGCLRVLGAQLTRENPNLPGESFSVMWLCLSCVKRGRKDWFSHALHAFPHCRKDPWQTSCPLLSFNFKSQPKYLQIGW